MIRFDNKVYFPLATVWNTPGDHIGYTHLEVYAYYYERTKMPTMIVSVVRVDDARPTGGMFGTSCMMMSVPTERYDLSPTAWTRNNNKKIAAFQEEIASELSAKAGHLWDKIKAFADKNGMSV